MILLFEPVVAGFVGYAVGERLGLKGYVGALVILASILVAEAPSWVLTARSSTGETGGRVPMTGSNQHEVSSRMSSQAQTEGRTPEAPMPEVEAA